jgi:hypothetical protein
LAELKSLPIGAPINWRIGHQHMRGDVVLVTAAETRIRWTSGPSSGQTSIYRYGAVTQVSLDALSVASNAKTITESVR